jgi:hypothetical protein
MMEFADYRNDVKKSKALQGFNLNRGIPDYICLSAGKTDERQFVKKLVKPGRTVVPIATTNAERTSMNTNPKFAISSFGSKEALERP